MKKVLMFMAGALIAFQTYSQDVDEILDNYFENTGGRDAWGALEGIKMSAKVNQGGMEIPLEIVQLKSGKQYTKFTLQGISIMQGVFDGETLWSINFQTQKAEKADAESTEMVKTMVGDFPDAFFNYKDRGYTAELVGEESIDGTDTYKIKLTMKPLTIDGNEVENITYYYFDKDSFVPIAQEKEILQGPNKGIISQTKLSDYQEVEGVYFPFSITQGVKGGPGQPLLIDEIVVNPEVDESVFTFPEGN